MAKENKIIVQSLATFGPMTLESIQKKLAKNKMILTIPEIEIACEKLLKRNEVKKAIGFNVKGYKV